MEKKGTATNQLQRKRQQHGYDRYRARVKPTCMGGYQIPDQCMVARSRAYVCTRASTAPHHQQCPQPTTMRWSISPTSGFDTPTVPVTRPSAREEMPSFRATMCDGMKRGSMVVSRRLAACWIMTLVGGGGTTSTRSCPLLGSMRRPCGEMWCDDDGCVVMMTVVVCGDDDGGGTARMVNS